MQDRRDRTPPEYVPAPRHVRNRPAPPDWRDALFVGGAVAVCASMFVSAAATTRPWHFAVIGAAALVCLTGLYLTRDRF